jgi:nucleoside 2-deoxyribosyltransferase
MAFKQHPLETFAADVLKPATREVGYDLVDMRDVSRAGIIDNLMREQIRDSAFVVVDLTHDNSGAYWEAGYAEGLGKQVIYICERSKFDRAKTHFDTNHCTTVLWDTAEPDAFRKEFIATLRRSLNLFSS